MTHPKDTDQPEVVCIKTISGTYFDLLNPDPADVKAIDIAHALSHVNRFGGHTPQPYSVAEHCMLVADRVKIVGGDRHQQLAALIHDAAEAYIQDVNGMLKHTDLLEGYRAVETVLTAVIEEAFGLAEGACEDPLVKSADMWAFTAECAMVRDSGVRIAPDAGRVKREYLARLYRLTDDGLEIGGVWT